MARHKKVKTIESLTILPLVSPSIETQLWAARILKKKTYDYEREQLKLTQKIVNEWEICQNLWFLIAQDEDSLYGELMWSNQLPTNELQMVNHLCVQTTRKISANWTF